MGKAVVSTTVGCEGLDARDGENILIRDDPKEFAAAVADVLEDMELRRRLETAARTTAVRTYDWDVIEKGMVADYMSLLGRRGAVDSSGVIPLGGIPARDPSGTAPQEAPPAPSA
jgi:glycosyltransferase involved in cell wall biosynthesis